MTLRQGETVRLANDEGRDFEDGILYYYPPNGTIGTVICAYFFRSGILAQVQFPKGTTKDPYDRVWVPEDDLEVLD